MHRIPSSVMSLKVSDSKKRERPLNNPSSNVGLATNTNQTAFTAATGPFGAASGMNTNISPQNAAAVTG